MQHIDRSLAAVLCRVMALPVSSVRAVIAGLIGAIVNSLAIHGLERVHVATGAAGLSRLFFAIVNWALGALGTSFRFPDKLGMVSQEGFHAFMGIMMALGYAWLFYAWLPGPRWLRGVTFSLIPWLMQSLVVAPYMGFGTFGARLSPATPYVSLGLNALYGLTVGLLYRPKDMSLT